MKIHEKYIKRCIDLAKKGLGTTYPNPMVGAVIVREGKVIGEGWHQKAGGAHAEVNAINSVKDKSLLKEATIYVSLEPCNHFGKTPPCSNLILENKIPKVVIGCVDPFDKVSGKGIEKLKKNGCEVTVGVLEGECKDLNKRFFRYHILKRPYVILKWAETKDGFMDMERKVANENHAKPNWITNSYSRQLVHKWRTEEQAIMVGTNTVLNDNPKLNVRSWFGKNPIRIVIDRSLRIPQNYNVFDGRVKTIVITENLETFNRSNLIFEKIDFSRNVESQICEVLYRYEIQSVIIEGGAQLLESFLKLHLWDEARVFVGSLTFSKGVKAPIIKGSESCSKKIQSDVLKVITNNNC